MAGLCTGQRVVISVQPCLAFWVHSTCSDLSVPSTIFQGSELLPHLSGVCQAYPRDQAEPAVVAAAGCLPESPGLPTQPSEIHLLLLWLLLDLPRVRGGLPAGPHVLHIPSETAASLTVAITLRVHMPGGETPPLELAQVPSESLALVCDHDVPGESGRPREEA